MGSKKGSPRGKNTYLDRMAMEAERNIKKEVITKRKKNIYSYTVKEEIHR